MSTKAAKPAKPPAPPKGVIPPSSQGGRSGFLSDVIVELGFAERAAVEQAVRAARSPGSTVARVLVESGAITEEQLAHATAERYGIAYIDLGAFTVEAGAANLIKPSAAKRYQAVPVGFVGGGLLVAMADPADALGVNDIAVMTKMDVKPAVASRPALDALLEALPLAEDFDEDGTPLAQEDAGADYAAAPAEPEASTSSAVFWQAGEDGADGAREELPADAEKAEPVPAAADGEETERLRAELDELRARARDGKAASAELEGLRERLTKTEAELDQAQARARDAERAAEEAAALAEELGSVKKELKRALADVDVRSEEMDALRERLTGAETEVVRLRAELEEAQRVAHEGQGRIEELEDADRRAEQARQAVVEMREESEREREQLMMDERDARAQLEESEARRGRLEDELRELQRRMQDALQALQD